MFRASHAAREINFGQRSVTLVTASRGPHPRAIFGASVSTPQQQKVPSAPQKLSSLHDLKYFAVATLSLVAGSRNLQTTIEGNFDAYRTSRAVDRGHPAEALWRHRAGGVLADGRADRARPRGDAVCQRRFGDVGPARSGMAARVAARRRGARSQCAAHDDAGARLPSAPPISTSCTFISTIIRSRCSPGSRRRS